MKQKFMFFFLVMFIYSLAFSQEITVKGKITDVKGDELPGMSVALKGTTKVVTTDFNGNYQIAAKVGDVLVISGLGYFEETATVSTAVLNVELSEVKDNQLEEVVITAFGEKKKAKSLAYSTQQISSKELERGGQTNILGSLQGMASGVSINKTSGGSGGGMDILIRGVTSLDAGNNNQPLIVVDGNILNNDTNSGNVLPSAGSNSAGSSEQFSNSNRIGDLNEADIESVSILKGSGATALYGIRGANGVVIITTKKGKIGKMRINLSSNVSFSEVNKYPELQSRWREGETGSAPTYTPYPRVLSAEAATPTEFSFYSPSYTYGFQTNGPLYSASDDPSIKFRDFYRDFFNIGHTFQNNLALSGADEKMNYYFSASTSKESGIVPNTNFGRKTLKVKADYKLSDNFDLGTSITYANSGGIKPNGGDKSIMSALSYWSPSIDVNDYLTATGQQKNVTAGITDNPRYFAENSNLTDDVNRWIANVSANWRFNDMISLSFNGSFDNYSDNRNRFVPANLDTGTQVKGFIVNETYGFKGLNSTLLVRFDKNITEKINNNLTIGGAIEQDAKDYLGIRGEGINVPGFNDLSNTTNFYQMSQSTNRRVAGLFFNYMIDYDDFIFLNVTGRRDEVSTLPKGNRTFFYPSAGLSFVFSDLIKEAQKTLTYGKLSVSWSETAKTPDPGTVGQYFYATSGLPFNGVGGFDQGNRLGDPDLLPESKQSLEFGAELGFFNRIRLDYTFYKNNGINQILPVLVSPTTGMSSFVTNAGEIQNIGHEVMLSTDNVKKENFSWKTTFGWNTNKGEVLSLTNNLKSITFSDSGFAGVVSQVKVGDSPGSLYGYSWKYIDGQLLLVNGFPSIDTDISHRTNIGNAFPDWVGTFSNNLRYKDIGLSFLLEYKKGGDMYDAGQRNSIRNGSLAITDFRNVNHVFEGVMSDGLGGYIPNTVSVPVNSVTYYRDSNRYNRASEILVQDASWIKLRNISLTYSLASEFVEKLKLNNFSISVSGNNFLLWSPFRGFDPEGNQYSAGTNSYGFTGLNVPLTQSYSMGINIGF